jgi:hypothetical protein
MILPTASRVIAQYIRRDHEITAAEITMKLTEDQNITVSKSTVLRHLRRMGYSNVLPRKTPMLTDEHRFRRIEWAETHKNDNWDRTIFSDETCFQLFRNTIRRWTRDPGSEVKRVPKNRQKVMVWGAISVKGKVGLCIFDGIMDARRYIDILQKNLLPAANRYFGNDWRFQHDNDPKHTARVTKGFLQENVPITLDWPANSPDLNPIEYVWHLLKTRVERQHPTNLEDLKRMIAMEWVELENSTLINIIRSENQRCRDVISADGEHIKY